jgi:hypothetical protein
MAPRYVMLFQSGEFTWSAVTGVRESGREPNQMIASFGVSGRSFSYEWLQDL